MNNLTIASQTIKDTISALDVGHAIGLEIRHGRCKCPIHGGNDFNCVLYQGNRGYYCHVCKSGGDVINLVRYSLFADSNCKEWYRQCLEWFNDTFRLGLDLGSTITPEKRRQAEKALQMRKRAIEFQQWKERLQFDLALTADEIVRMLEEQRDRNVPRTVGEAWNNLFCEAVELLPEARRFADDCMMYCMKERKE